MVGIRAKYWRAVTVLLLAVSLYALTAAAANPIHFHQSGGADCFVCHFSSQALAAPELPAVFDGSLAAGDFVFTWSHRRPLAALTARAYGRAPPAA